jgi:hypothetical protein
MQETPPSGNGRRRFFARKMPRGLHLSVTFRVQHA